MAVGHARSVEALAASAQLLVALAASRFHRKGPGVAPAKYARDAHTLLFGRTRSRRSSRGGEDKSRVCKDNICFPEIYALAVDYLTLLLGYHPLDRFMCRCLSRKTRSAFLIMTCQTSAQACSPLSATTRTAASSRISTRPTLHPCRTCKRGNHAREECRNRRGTNSQNGVDCLFGPVLLTGLYCVVIEQRRTHSLLTGGVRVAAVVVWMRCACYMN